MRSRSRRSGRSGLSEIVSSLAVLAVTIAILGGIGAVALGSIQSSSDLVSSNSQNAAKGYGTQLALVSVQTNSSGSYAWFYNYGWVSGTLSATYLNGGLTQWPTSCSGVLQPGKICAIHVPPNTHGEVSLLFGTKSLGFTV